MPTATQPAAPLVRLTPTAPAITRVVNAANSAALQAALNSALPGDAIKLVNGQSYAGNFTYPNLGQNGWISLITDPGSPAKLITFNSEPALKVNAGAHQLYVKNVEFTVDGSVGLCWIIVYIDPTGATTTAQLATDVIFDGCAIYNTPTGNSRAGLQADGARIAFINGRIQEIHWSGFDTQGISVITGSGPFLFADSLIQGAGQCIMFGGADPLFTLIPSDIEVARCELSKPLTWKPGSPTYNGTNWTIKNHFELKVGRRVHVHGCLLQHNWSGLQTGTSIVLTPRNQGGFAPFNLVEDVLIENCRVDDVEKVFNIQGRDETGSQGSRRLAFRNIIGTNVTSSTGGFTGDTTDITLDHMTVVPGGYAIWLGDGASAPANFTCLNSVFGYGSYGPQWPPDVLQRMAMVLFPGDWGDGQGNIRIAASFYGQGAWAGIYGAYGTPAAAGIDTAGVLALNSPMKNAGTDSKDIGVDFTGLVADTPTVLSPVIIPPPPVVPPPVDSFTETWTAANSAASITADHPWTRIGSTSGPGGAIGIDANRAVPTAVVDGFSFVRCDQALTSDDQDVSVTLQSFMFATVPSGGIFLNQDGTSTLTCYWFRAKRDPGGFNGYQLIKLVAGVETIIGSLAQAPVPNDVLRLRRVRQGNGDIQLSPFVNGVPLTVVIDPAANALAGRSVGIVESRWTAGDFVALDSFSAAIVGVAPVDTTAPAVAITTPANAATISGTVPVQATATDVVGVTSVRFFLDSVQTGPTLSTPPFTYNLDTTVLSNAAHTIRVDAQDAAGNTGSASISVTVNNVAPPGDVTPPVISNTQLTAPSTVSLTLDWQTNEPADTQVAYGLTSALGTLTPLLAPLVTSHSVTITGLQPGTLYFYQLRSRDAAGNLQAVNASGQTAALPTIPGATVFVPVLVPGPTVYVDVPGPTVIVQGPTVFVTQFTTATIPFAGSLRNVPPGNYRVMAMVVDENNNLVAPPAFATTTVPDSANATVQPFNMNMTFRQQGQKVNW